MKKYYQKVLNLFYRYERHISSMALIGGFIIDSLTLRRVDLLIENLVLATYLLVAASGIIILNFFAEKTHPLIPFAIQFAFGGLFSGFLVFYSRSTSYISSWPFLLILVILLIGNEVFKKYYHQLTFQLAVLFFALFSYSIFYIPIIAKRMGDDIFLLSGVVSLVIIFVFLYCLSFLTPQTVQKSKKFTIISIFGIYILITGFYFLNIIPPLPLSLKEVHTYHMVQRVGGGYSVREEESIQRSFFKKYQTVHVTPGEQVYVFSSVFAPTALNTSIAHRWQYYDEESKEWITASRVTFPIVGGRDGGYRGYSFKSNMSPGTWRVNIETARGQIIGRTFFIIKYVDSSVPLVTKTI